MSENELEQLCLIWFRDIQQVILLSTNLSQIGSNSFIPVTTNVYQKVTNW